jgi:electron transfer flavoprotein alpha subunit
VSDVLVLAEHRRGELRPVGRELLGAAHALSEQGLGPVVLATIDAEAEANAAQAAVGALLAERLPAVVLAAHGRGALGFAPALAARGGYGFARDVTAVNWERGELRAERGVYGEPVRELGFPGKDTVLLLLRAGAFDPVDPRGAELEQIELRPTPDARVRHDGYLDRPVEARDQALGEADFVLAAGRGLADEGAQGIARMQRLADRLEATLAVSGALVEGGLAPGVRKAGISGRRVAPSVYVALGISGAPQHLAGIARSHTIVAVNRDPDARIFEIAHYGAVADAFEVLGELERRLG